MCLTSRSNLVKRLACHQPRAAAVVLKIVAAAAAAAAVVPSSSSSVAAVRLSVGFGARSVVAVVVLVYYYSNLRPFVFSLKPLSETRSAFPTFPIASSSIVSSFHLSARTTSKTPQPRAAQTPTRTDLYSSLQSNLTRTKSPTPLDYLSLSPRLWFRWRLRYSSLPFSRRRLFWLFPSLTSLSS